jgi:hypothetical protein
MVSVDPESEGTRLGDDDTVVNASEFTLKPLRPVVVTVAVPEPRLGMATVSGLTDML